MLVTDGSARALGTVTELQHAGARVTVAAPGAAALTDLAERGLVTVTTAVDVLEPGLALVVLAGGPDDDRLAGLAADAGLLVTTVARDVAPDVPVELDDEAARGTLAPLEPGEVVLVGGGPGDPGLLTLAGLAAVEQADVIATDRLAPLGLLDRARPDAEIVDVSKTPRGAFTTQETINALLVDRALAGRRVVRLKGGDSFVFGRGGEEWQACAAAGVRVRVIPGVTSATAAPAAAGLPLTHRTLTQGFAVVSGHVGPGDPRSTVDWAGLARSGLTLVVLMGWDRLAAITDALIEAGRSPDTPAAVVADATLPSMRVVRAPLAALAGTAAEAGLRPPVAVVIGEVAGFDPAAQP